MKSTKFVKEKFKYYTALAETAFSLLHELVSSCVLIFLQLYLPWDIIGAFAPFQPKTLCNLKH